MFLTLFKETFKRVFARDSKNDFKMAFNANMEVKTSRELKVMGCIGPCVSAENKSTGNVSEQELGIGGTSQWKFCGLYPNTTFAVFLEVVGQVGGWVSMSLNINQYVFFCFAA